MPRLLLLLRVLVACLALVRPLPALAPHLSGQPEIAKAMAKIVLVGTLARDQDLAQLLDQLLSQNDIRSELQAAETVDPNALFAEATAGETLVFVSLPGPNYARLHFRAPDGDRFLLRKVDLPSGIDAVGRELLGQVVTSSVLALRDSTEGLSRAEAEAELAAEPTRPGETMPEPALASLPQSSADVPTLQQPPPSQRTQQPQQAQEPETTPWVPDPRRRWSLKAAATYFTEWAGSDLGPAHGPGVAIGARWHGDALLGLELAAQRLLAQHLQDPRVSADLQRTAVGMLMEGGWQLSHGSRTFVVLGPYLELTRLHAYAPAPGVRVGDDRTDVAPALRGEVRYEIVHGHASFGVSALINVSLTKTHYDISQGGEQKTIARLAQVRPGLTLSVGVH